MTNNRQYEKINYTWYCKTLNVGIPYFSRVKQNVKLKGTNIDYIATLTGNLDVDKLWLTNH